MIWAISRGQRDLVARGGAALEGGLDRLLIREAVVTAGQHDMALQYPGRVVWHARMPDAASLAASTGSGLHLPGDADVLSWRRQVSVPLGKSCHSVSEARLALEAGCDWVFLSPVFAPLSKPGDERPQLGPVGLTGVIALGGITLDRLGGCRAAGALGVATMSHILDDGDPGATARIWQARWRASG